MELVLVPEAALISLVELSAAKEDEEDSSCLSPFWKANSRKP